MKKWNAPEMAELNIAATANGCLDFFFESCLTHDGDKADQKPATPDEEEALS